MPFRTKDEKAAYQRRYVKKHYLANRAKYKAKKRAFVRALQREIDKIKEASPCMDCGKKWPACVMDFDHREPAKKGGREFRISALVSSGKKTQVYLEIEKCDLICSNCHRMRTHLGRF